jgi:hypothetical protein
MYCDIRKGSKHNIPGEERVFLLVIYVFVVSIRYTRPYLITKRNSPLLNTVMKRHGTVRTMRMRSALRDYSLLIGHYSRSIYTFKLDYEYIT